MATLCLNCMNGILDESGKCEACGGRNEDIVTSSRHLPLRTILAGKYLVGRVLGEGGFGITYLGYDLNLEIPVAIKEFCPRDFAGRETTDGLTLTPFDEECTEFYEEEKGKFIGEAKRLAKFRKQNSIVSVQDYFQENGTAYIVMEYIDGQPLKKFLKEMGHPMKVEEVLPLLKPVMEALQTVHEAGIIHRDISPDNIMLTNNHKEVYLIDFGTARMSDYAGERSLSVYKKGSYTPVEQQSRRGNQGPWTDIYALCATIYLCITGKNIPEAVDRMMDDMILPPSRLGIEIAPHVEAALMKGLAIKPEQRMQSMAELIEGLYSASQVPKQSTQQTAETLEEKSFKVKASEIPKASVEAAQASEETPVTAKEYDEKIKNLERPRGMKWAWLAILNIAISACAGLILAVMLDGSEHMHAVGDTVCLIECICAGVLLYFILYRWAKDTVKSKVWWTLALVYAGAAFLLCLIVMNALWAMELYGLAEIAGIGIGIASYYYLCKWVKIETRTVKWGVGAIVSVTVPVVVGFAIAVIARPFPVNIVIAGVAALAIYAILRAALSKL